MRSELYAFQLGERNSVRAQAHLVKARVSGLAIIDTDHLGLRSMPARVPHTLKQKYEYRAAIVGDSVDIRVCRSSNAHIGSNA